jgi:predicted AAA+ superfamily ATPase
VRNNGSKLRHKGNRLVFIAPEHGAVSRVRDCARTVLAWNSIVEDVKDGRLNIDRHQEQQARKELQTSEEVLPRAVRECFRWLLCPNMATPAERVVNIEAFPVNTGGSSYGQEIERVCVENELVIGTWSPVHLRAKLKELYWKDGKTAVKAMAFWEDSTRYLYLPRLRNLRRLQVWRREHPTG